MARENETWSYTRSKGALQNVGYRIGRNAIKRILREPFAERFVLSIRTECLNRLVPLGEAHLRRAILEYTEHYCWASQCTSLLCA